jgi:type IV secretory pathway VirB4 component
MPKTTAQRQSELQNPAFCELLPVRDFLDNVMIREDGSFVAGFHLSGSQTYFGDDAARNDLKRRLENLFLTIPEESMRMQFRYEVEESVGDLLERYDAARRSTDPRVVAMDKERIATWQGQCDRGEYLLRTAAVYFIWNPTKHEKMMQDGGKIARKKANTTGKQGPQSFSEKISALIDKIFSSGSIDKNIQSIRKMHEERLQKFETLIVGAESSLAGAGLGPKRMTHEDLFLEIKRSLCPTAPNKQPFRTGVTEDGHLSTFALSERYISAREQLSSVSILGQDETSLNIDGILWSAVTVKVPPDTTYSGVLRQLLTLGFPLVVNSHLYVADQRKVLDTYKKRYKKYQASLNDGKGGRRVDMNAQVAARELIEIQEKIIASSSKTVKMVISVMVRSSAPAYTEEQHETAARQLSERVQKVLYVVGNMNGATGFAENLALRDIFIDSLPGMAGELKRDLDLLTEHAADLVPVEVPWAGTVDDVSMLIRTPWRQLIPMSHFSPSLENANMLLVGVSGTGKGMFVG